MSDDKYVLNAEYTGISLAYKNPSYIADKVLPRVTVGSKNFSYDKYPIDAFLNVPETKIGDLGEAATMDVKKERIPAALDYHAVKGFVAQTDIDEQAEGEDLLGDNVLLLTEGLLLAREVRVAKLLQDSTLYGSNVETLSGTDQLNNAASSLLDTIFDARKQMLVKPNKIVVSDDGATDLQRHPDVVSMYKSEFSETKTGIVPLSYVAQLLKVDEIIVGQSVVNAAKKGQTANLSQAWGNDLIMFYQNPLAKPKQGMTFGYTAQKGTRQVSQFFDGEPGYSGVHKHKVAEAVKELIVAPSCGFLFKNAFGS